MITIISTTVASARNPCVFSANGTPRNTKGCLTNSHIQTHTLMNYPVRNLFLLEIDNDEFLLDAFIACRVYVTHFTYQRIFVLIYSLYNLR